MKSNSTAEFWDLSNFDSISCKLTMFYVSQDAQGEGSWG